jgi:hypothetical protein
MFFPNMFLSQGGTELLQTIKALELAMYLRDIEPIDDWTHAAKFSRRK